MRLVISSISFILAALSSWAQPTISLNGPKQARFGLPTVIKTEIVRNSTTGPVRLVTELPQGWILRSSDSNLGLINQEGNLVKTVWLNLPLQDTIRHSLLVIIPENHSGDAVIKAHLEYYSGDNIHHIACSPFAIEVRKYYSRY
ncbi:MAG TPA: hypothetical protein PL185_03130 [Flavobacteriales bacterium]|jgi:hypothetical protein|nr:hypothetical protein [Flavobacteriales bacterium]HPH81534.1 hypothetical protein [Flavobacteriales bacterium]